MSPLSNHETPLLPRIEAQEPRPRKSRLVDLLPPIAHRVRPLASGVTICLAFAGSTLAYIRRQYPSWNTASTSVYITWATISLIFLIVLCITQPAINRRLPVVIGYISLCAWVLHARLNLDSETLVTLAPPLSTILGLIALFTPPETLALATSFVVRVWQGEPWDQDFARYLRNE